MCLFPVLFYFTCVLYSNVILFCMYVFILFFFFKQKTAYEMRISDWSSDVCSSDLDHVRGLVFADVDRHLILRRDVGDNVADVALDSRRGDAMLGVIRLLLLGAAVGFAHRALDAAGDAGGVEDDAADDRTEEQKSELQSLMGR